MVDITHYEVYVDRGNGWKLEERFPAEQRDQAIKYARDKEHVLLADAIAEEPRKEVGRNEDAAHVAEVQVLVAIRHAGGDDGAVWPDGTRVFGEVRGHTMKLLGCGGSGFPVAGVCASNAHRRQPAVAPHYRTARRLRVYTGGHEKNRRHTNL